MTTADKRQELWEEVSALQDADAKSVLSFMYGWMGRNDDFFEGIEAALKGVKELRA